MAIIYNNFFHPFISGMGKDIIVIKEESKKYKSIYACNNYAYAMVTKIPLF